MNTTFTAFLIILSSLKKSSKILITTIKLLFYTFNKNSPRFLRELLIAVPCRINYSGKNWDSILKTLANENGYQEIEVRNRMQIVDDLFAFATADILAYSFVLDAIMYLQYENDYLPWGIALSYLRDIRSYLMRTELFEPFQVSSNLLYRVSSFLIEQHNYLHLF